MNTATFSFFTQLNCFIHIFIWHNGTYRTKCFYFMSFSSCKRFSFNNNNGDMKAPLLASASITSTLSNDPYIIWKTPIIFAPALLLRSRWVCPASEPILTFSFSGLPIVVWDKCFAKGYCIHLPFYFPEQIFFGWPYIFVRLLLSFLFALLL